MNALSALHDEARQGVNIAGRWQPWAAEYTSLAGLILALPVAVVAERLASGPAPGWRRIGLLIIGSVAFSAVHIAVMIALRYLVWQSAGRTYHFDFAHDWIYEYRKDLLGYAIALGAMALARRWPSPLPGAAPEKERTELRLPDGRGTLSVDPETLVAASGAGNYVELIFAAGRRRLIRATLAAVEAALVGHGFGRSHKSWLVRLAAVTAIERTAAGDYRLHLQGQLTAPLSRRSGDLLRTVRERLERNAGP